MNRLAGRDVRASTYNRRTPKPQIFGSIWAKPTSVPFVE